jgi:hypothetical protein
MTKRNPFNAAPPTNPLAYQSMVIRYWQEHHPIKGPLWRYTLVNPSTGQQTGFSSFAELTAFLAGQFGEEG